MNRRNFLARAATAAAVTAIAVPVAASAEPCPLADLERQWLRCAAAEASAREAMIARFGGRPFEQLSADEISDFMDDYRSEDSPVKRMKAVAAKMAEVPAKDRAGVEAKLRVALGRGRKMGAGCYHRPDADLIASALSDLGRLPA